MAGEPDLSQACAVPAPGMLFGPGHGPSCPVVPVPREQLGPWNMLSPSAAVGMMERQVIFNSRDSLRDGASSSLWKETSREGGDPNSGALVLPLPPLLFPQLLGLRVWLSTVREGLAVVGASDLGPSSRSLGSGS